METKYNQESDKSFLHVIVSLLQSFRLTIHITRKSSYIVYHLCKWWQRLVYIKDRGLLTLKAKVCVSLKTDVCVFILKTRGLFVNIKERYVSNYIKGKHVFVYIKGRGLFV